MSERISIKPNVCNGRPVIRGTRITVQTILEFLAAGDSIEDVLEEFPKLTRADVQACINYASRPIGLAKGQFTVPDDFNAPLPENLLKAFEGK